MKKPNKVDRITLGFTGREIGHFFSDCSVDITLDADDRDDARHNMYLVADLLYAIATDDIPTIRKYAYEHGWCVQMFPNYTPDDPEYSEIKRIRVTLDSGTVFFLDVDKFEY